jgi:uncharacterized protein YqhQ
MSGKLGKPLKPINYGGQAVIEGVMMRGSKAYAVAVRNPAGEIVIHSEPLDQRIYGSRLAKLPFLRGLTLLWDALGLGIKSLLFSADVAMQEEQSNADTKQQAELPTGLIVAFSLTLSILLFFVLTAFLASLIERWFGLAGSPLAGNLIEGIIRLALLIGYIWAIGRMDDVRRLFGYHGAEHKTINAYEARAELTPESVARFPLEHPRCGTAFLLTVVVVSILIYSLFPPMGLALRIVSRLLLLPVIAGIAYEFIRFTAAHQANWFIRLITRPNLALQRLTTREPDREMLAVAIAAFKQVLESEESEVGQPVAIAVPTMPGNELPV